MKPWNTSAIKTGDPFYQSPAWKKLRKWVMIRDKGICQYTLKKTGKAIKGNIGDHILPKRFFPELALDEKNIVCCSEYEHNKKRQIERKASNRFQCKALMIEHGYYTE